jgi:hypothetical protein
MRKSSKSSSQSASQSSSQSTGRKRKASQRLDAPESPNKQANPLASILGLARDFINDGWAPASTLRLKINFNDGDAAQINTRVVTRQLATNTDDLFFMIFSPQLWVTLCDVVNRNMLAEYMVVSKDRQRYYKRLVTPVELSRFYMSVILLENIRSREHHSLKSNRVFLRERGEMPMGICRFEAIFNCLCPTNTEFDTISSDLRNAYQSPILDVKLAAADEGSIAYQVSGNVKKKFELTLHDPVPHHYVPRKPHPNCMLVYKLCTRISSSGLPYLIDFEPCLNLDHAITGEKATLNFLERWSFGSTAHFVIDAGFSSLDLMKQFNDSNALLTMGCNPAHSPYWNLLTRGQAGGQWNAAYNTDMHTMMSVKLEKVTNTENNPYNLPTTPVQAVKCHHLMTNAFSITPIEVPPDKEEVKYSQDELKKNQVPALKKILKDAGLRYNKLKKQELITKIMNNCNKTPDGPKAVINALAKNKFTTVPKHHQFYKENFNSVDLHDSRFYDQNYQYPCNNWRTKMLLSLLTDAMTNVFTLVNEHRVINIIDLRREIAEKVMTNLAGMCDTIKK